MMQLDTNLLQLVLQLLLRWKQLRAALEQVDLGGARSAFVRKFNPPSHLVVGFGSIRIQL
jgi:hypothetical protein